MMLSCGEALFDLFLGDEDAGGEFDMRACPGGSPFNVAIGIARLGGSAALLTGMSDDILGERLFGLLRREGVETGYIQRSGRRTTLSVVGLDADGHPGYMFYGLGSADCSLTPEDLPEIGPEITGLHFGSYSLAVRPAADAFLQLLQQSGDRFVSVDPNVRITVEPDLDVWRARLTDYAARADLLKISMEDLETLYPGADAERHVADWITAGVKLAVVTDGGDAVRAWTADGGHVRVTPDPVQVIDSVGAGDSFQAALLTQIQAQGPDPKLTLDTLTEEAIRRILTNASRAAAITCTRRGADLPRRADLPGFGA